ncbi:MAG TPA: hypothetical protein PLM89_08415, partial [Anaerolineales bacterium]|nr:hypothetical protein [Anaerolineales bacterium]
MQKKKSIILFVLLFALVLSGCTGAVAWPGLSTSGDVAYLAHTSTVYAVDLKTHNLLWSFSGEKAGFTLFNTNPDMFIVPPVTTTDGLVVIANANNRHMLYAVDPKNFSAIDKAPTPAVRWKFNQAKGLWIAPPLEIDGLLFAPNSDGKIYVLDLNDGMPEKQAVRTIEVSQPGKNESRLWAQPITDRERLFITSLDT